MTLGAPRHCLIAHLLNRLNHHNLDKPIPAINAGALLNKASRFLIHASDCTPISGKASLDGGLAPQAIMEECAAVASAHKSGLQSFRGFLWLKTRVLREI
jgi:hypothetical protein